MGYSDSSSDGCWSMKRCGICLLVTAVVILIAGIAVSVALPKVIRHDLDKEFLMLPGTKGFNMWKNQSSSSTAGGDNFYYMYFYNITNPSGMLQGEAPKVEQVGPFRYHYYQENFNITWSEDENVITYTPWEYYVAIDDDSVPITTLNIPFQAVYVSLPVIGFPDALLAGVIKSLGLTAEEALFSTHTAHELLFGFGDPILDKFSLGDFPGFAANQTTPAAAYAKGPSAMYTGKNDTAMLRQTILWKGTHDVWCCLSGVKNRGGKHCHLAWNSSVANQALGGDGHQFPPYMQAGQPQTIFVTTIFRSATVINPPGPQQTVTFKDINLLRYSIPASVLQNSTENPANKQWYSNGYYGLLNTTSCGLNMPLFLSKPHFLDGDPRLHAAIDWVDEPQANQRALWDTHIDVEPYTGKTLRAFERLQVNIEIGPLKGLNFTNPASPNGLEFPKLQRTVMPVLWLEKRGSLSDAQAKTFFDDILVPVDAAVWAKWVGIALGIGLGLVGAFVLYQAIHGPPTSTLGEREPVARDANDYSRMDDDAEDSAAEYDRDVAYGSLGDRGGRGSSTTMREHSLRS